MYFAFWGRVSSRFRRRLERLFGFDCLIVTAGKSDVPFFHEILHAKFVRIHAELARDAIHMRLGSEKPLRLARGAHLSAGKIVRVDARNGDARMLGAVTAARVSDPADDGAGSKSTVRAGVEISVHLVGDDRAVTFDAGFQLHDHRMPRRAGKKLFAILHHHLDRPADCGQRANNKSAHR